MSDDTKAGEKRAVLVDRANCGAAAFASDDETRRSIYVNITHERTEAANGHILIRVPLPKMEVADFPVRPQLGGGFAGEVQIEADKLAKVGKGLPKNGIPILQMAHVGVKEDGGVVVVSTDLESDRVTLGTQAAWPFPDTNMVMPQGAGRKIVIQAKYLKMIAEFALRYSTSCAPSVGLEVQDDPNMPMSFSIHLDGPWRIATGVVMPIKLD
jgi:hypothetical protein